MTFYEISLFVPTYYLIPYPINILQHEKRPSRVHKPSQSKPFRFASLPRESASNYQAGLTQNNESTPGKVDLLSNAQNISVVGVNTRATRYQTGFSVFLARTT